MHRSLPFLLAALVVAGCGSGTSESGQTDEQRAKELARGACLKYSLMVRNATKPMAGAFGSRIMEKVVEETKQAAALDARWKTLSAAMADHAKKGAVIRAECKVAKS